MSTHAEVAPSQVYVWEFPVRLTHWVIALSIVLLAGTGIYIGNPFLTVAGEATDHFVTGTVRIIHFYAAIAFALAVVARVVWMFMGNRYARWRQFVPVEKVRRRGLLETLQFYLFLRRNPPAVAGHNPLAGAAYIVVFGLYFVEILTGLTMYAASAPVGSPFRAFAALMPIFGGLQSARFIHHVVMWLILGFVAHHIWSAIEVALVERNGTIESIVTGYKNGVPEEEVAERGD
ncbi:MAG: Ni/Fe-hydrogenase, b-type cytochrome subunit [Gemmatimonadetes bacterium]|nr:Ni/Fe-hydrogenase, b-type cytochrome subunit [Gemmatimonadota bacterium]NNM32772.1 Ni/Fe-hydrogenase, b-type cytochrome subunit [Gemmatimonadota bacterium]